MKIYVDKIEFREPAASLQVRKFFDSTMCEMYLHEAMPGVVHVLWEDRYNLVPFVALKNIIIAPQSVPQHQPVGIDALHDTPSGRRVPRKVEDAKKAIAKLDQPKLRPH